jgi:hypothetical protein
MLISRKAPPFPSFAPMLKGSTENSEPIASYTLMPTAYTASEYQQPYVTQFSYGPTLAPAFPRQVPSPTPIANAAHGIPSPRLPPVTGASRALSAPAPVQTRALHVPHISRSRPRKSLLTHAPKATSDGRHSHPLFRHSRCTGKRKAVCVRAPTRCF